MGEHLVPHSYAVRMSFVDPGTPRGLADALRAAFEVTYGGPATAMARAPGRVNLMGEHTDYNAGLCLPVALPHSTYAAVATRADDQVRIASRQEPDPWRGRLSNIGPGQVTGWASYAAGVIWALREAGHDVPGLDVFVDGTVPLGAGLSSSAALECSVAVAVTGVLELSLDDALRRELVNACVRAESEVAGAPTGGMDQTVAMFARAGTALLIDFDEDSIRPVELGLAGAGLALLVTDTRVSHALVDGVYAARRSDCEAAASALGVPSLRRAGQAQVNSLKDDRFRRRARHVITEIARVEATISAFEGKDWAALGPLFAQSHASMRDDFEISCPELDLAVAAALEAGAIAARMTGGGFGGSSVAIVPGERVEGFVRAIDAAFDAAGFWPPAHLRAEPSAAAVLVDGPGDGDVRA